MRIFAAVALTLIFVASTAADAANRRGSHRTGGYNSHGRGSHYVGGSSAWRSYGRGYYRRGLDSWGPRHHRRCC